MLKRLQQGINHSFGSKRGLLNYGLARCGDMAGCYARYRRIDWERVERLVFVCAGNICRSPLAERVALDAGYNACSFGVSCAPDRPADPRVIRLAAARGFTLIGHRSQCMRDIVLSPADLIVAMEAKHLSSVASHFGETHQSTLLGLWHECSAPYIHDPFSADEEYFFRCSQFLIEATSGLTNHCLRARRE